MHKTFNITGTFGNSGSVGFCNRNHRQTLYIIMPITSGKPPTIDIQTDIVDGVVNAKKARKFIEENKHRDTLTIEDVMLLRKELLPRKKSVSGLF